MGAFKTGLMGCVCPAQLGPGTVSWHRTCSLLLPTMQLNQPSIYLQLLTHLAYVFISGYKAGVSLVFSVPTVKGKSRPGGSKGSKNQHPAIG